MSIRKCKFANEYGFGLKVLMLLLLVVAPLAVNAQSGFTSNFDHFTTGFPLEGSHRTVGCESCHVSGVFKGTPRQCFVCHARAGFVKATPLPIDHISSTTQCQDCHTETTWAPVRFVDHTQVIGSCSRCHNDQIATGKPANHLVTTEECDTCHRSTGWVPTFFNHGGIINNCISCHNGIDATGKNLTHINTTNICEDCHNNFRWTPVVRVDHTQVLGTCTSCHNGTIATGKDQNHIQTNAQCDDCHTTNAWEPAVFDHSAVQPGTCTNCHNGTVATGKDQNHIQTNAQCDECHTTNAWIPANFDHNSVMGSCLACHAGDYEAGPHKKIKDPEIKYTVVELQECSGACHFYTDPSLTTLEESRPGPEHRVTDGDF